MYARRPACLAASRHAVVKRERERVRGVESVARGRGAVRSLHKSIPIGCRVCTSRAQRAKRVTHRPKPKGRYSSCTHARTHRSRHMSADGQRRDDAISVFVHVFFRASFARCNAFCIMVVLAPIHGQISSTSTRWAICIMFSHTNIAYFRTKF